MTVRFVSEGKTFAEAASAILFRGFNVEDIPLDRAMSELRAKPDPRKDREAQAIWAVYGRFEPGFAWAGGKFLLPVSASGSPFGRIRRHAAVFVFRWQLGSRFPPGIDFAVPEGTAVAAPAAGTVVMTAHRMLTGETIVLEHAPGVYSTYFHLSKILVRQGQKILPGERMDSRARLVLSQALTFIGR